MEKNKLFSYVRKTDEPVSFQSGLGYERTGLSLREIDWTAWPCKQHIHFLMECVSLPMEEIIESTDPAEEQRKRNQAFTNNVEFLKKFGYGKTWKMKCKQLDENYFAWIKVGPDHPLWNARMKKI